MLAYQYLDTCWPLQVLEDIAKGLVLFLAKVTGVYHLVTRSSPWIPCCRLDVFAPERAKPGRMQRNTTEYSKLSHMSDQIDWIHRPIVYHWLGWKYWIPWIPETSPHKEIDCVVGPDYARKCDRPQMHTHISNWIVPKKLLTQWWMLLQKRAQLTCAKLPETSTTDVEASMALTFVVCLASSDSERTSRHCILQQGAVVQCHSISAYHVIYSWTKDGMLVIQPLNDTWFLKNTHVGMLCHRMYAFTCIKRAVTECHTEPFHARQLT